MTGVQKRHKTNNFYRLFVAGVWLQFLDCYVSYNLTAVKCDSWSQLIAVTIITLQTLWWETGDKVGPLYCQWWLVLFTRVLTADDSNAWQCLCLCGIIDGCQWSQASSFLQLFVTKHDSMCTSNITDHTLMRWSISLCSGKPWPTFPTTTALVLISYWKCNAFYTYAVCNDILTSITVVCLPGTW